MSPLDIKDILERARNSAQMGDHEEAERLLKSYIARVPASREAHLLLGTTFAREGKFTDAADEFITLLVRDPRDLEALNNVAVICRRQGKYQEALDYLKEAIEIDPGRAEFHYNVGNIHKQLGNSKAASMSYARVIELDPGYVPAYNNLGTIYEQLKEYDKAYNVFRKGLALDNNNPTLHFNYGIALEANGRLEDAVNEYRIALRSKPGWLEPMNNLGIVLFKQGQHDKAIATFNRILHTDPFNAEALNNMGVVLTDQGKIQEAIKNYRRAIEADPKYTKAVVNLERALETAGDFSDAVIELEKLVKLSPESVEIRNRLAGLYLKMERYPEALEQAESALEWEPESIQALRTKGAVQRILGNDADAQACFERILALDPGNYSFLLDLADIHFNHKEYKEAEERIQSYLIRRPNDRNAKLLLGKLYAEMGNRTHAIQVFEELSKADPNDTEALAAAAELHKEAGSLEKAVRTADKLVNLQGKRGTADDLSDLNKSLAFYENAVNAYSSSVREMWNRNIKLMSGGEEESSEEEDISRLMGAAGTSRDIDEETETLFTEGLETFPDELEEDDLFPENDPYGDIPEEAEQPRYRDPLDALASASPGGGDPFSPGHPASYSPEETASPQPAPPPQSGELPAGPQMPMPPDFPQYPPPYPPFGQMPQAGQRPPQPEMPAFAGEEPQLPVSAAKPGGEEMSLPPGEDLPKEEPETGMDGGEDLFGEEPGIDISPGEEEPAIDMSVGEDFPEEEPEADMDGEEALPGEEEISPEDDIFLSDGMELSPDEEEPVMGEEIPENLFSEEPASAGEDLPAEFPDEDFGIDLTPQEPQPREAEPGAGEEDAAFGPASRDVEPGMDMADTFPGETEELLAEKPAPAAESMGQEGPEEEGISALIGLLKYLRRLTEKLPEKERNNFLQGKFPSALESVIDSFKKLAIIKETADGGTSDGHMDKEQTSSEDGSGT